MLFKIPHYRQNSLFLRTTMIEFKLDGEYIPMIQLLKATNLVATGGEAQIVVSQGLVKYNGTVDYRKRLKVKQRDVVEFDNQKIIVI